MFFFPVWEFFQRFAAMYLRSRPQNNFLLFFVLQLYSPPTCPHHNKTTTTMADAALCPAETMLPYRQADVLQSRIGARRIGKDVGQPSVASVRRG